MLSFCVWHCDTYVYAVRISCSILFVFAIYDIVTERHVCAGDRDVSV